MTSGAYFDGSSYIEVPDSPDFSTFSGTKKLTVLYTYQPESVSGDTRVIEKGYPGNYEWVAGHRPETNTHFFLYEFNRNGGYGIGVPYNRVVNTPTDIIHFAGVINDSVPTDRYLSIYSEGVLAWGHRAITGVAGITMTDPGYGYTSSPTIVISGGGGSGATCSAYISGGQVYVDEMNEYGQGYTSDPTVSFIGGGGNGAAGFAYRCFPYDGISPLWIGWNPYRDDLTPIKGWLYNVSIFKDELSASDILALTNGSKLPIDFASLVMWHDYTTGTANDLSGHGHDGILHGVVITGGSPPPPPPPTSETPNYLMYIGLAVVGLMLLDKE